MIRYTDDEIKELLLEPKKPLSGKLKLRFKSKGAHNEQDIELIGENGNRFRLMLRQSKLNTLDFSVILAYCPSETSKDFRLCRYNGKHQHSNRVEGTSLFDYHIHFATERYQGAGAKEEAYAEPTDRYSDLDSALRCILTDCYINLSNEKTRSLF